MVTYSPTMATEARAAKPGVDYRVHDRAAILTIDHPPLNLLSAPVRTGLAAGLAAAHDDPRVAVLVILGRGRAFIAGADIAEFGQTPVEPSLDALLELIEASRNPVIAALNGVALGGGLEVALCCDYRVAAPTASLGLPEVKLGLLPGGGGTQRLPRLIGAERALELILSGETISAARAAELGILDAVLVGDEHEAAALAYAEALLDHGARLRKLRDEDARILGDRNKPELFTRAYARASAAMPGRFALEMIVECVDAAVHAPSFAAGMEVERRCFAQCLAHPQHAALEHLFFAERGCAKVPDVGRETPSRTIARALIDGQTEAAVASLADRLHGAGVELQRFDPARAGAELGSADLVILDRASRPELVAALPDALAPTATILSLGSEQDLDELGDATGHPSVSLGAELAPTGRVLELTRGAATSPEALATVLALGKRLGLIVVVSSRGAASGQNRYSIAGRMRAAFERELQALLGAGARASDVHAALVELGFRTISLRALASKPEPEPEPELRLDAHTILTRALGAAAAEGRRLLAEGVALRPGDIDVVCVHGLGFAEISGGPMHWAAAQRQNS